MPPNGFLSLGLPSSSFLSTHEADIVRGAPKPIQAWKDGLPLSLEGQWEPRQEPEERKPRMGGH